MTRLKAIVAIFLAATFANLVVSPAQAAPVPTHAVSQAGQLEYNYEALLYHSFGPHAAVVPLIDCSRQRRTEARNKLVARTELLRPLSE